MQPASDKVKHLVLLETDFLIKQMVYSGLKQKPYRILNQDRTVRTILVMTMHEYFGR